MDPRLVETARIGTQFVLLIAVAYLVARICWLLVAPGDAVSTLTPRPLPTPVGQRSVSDVRADISLLLKENPFEVGEGASEAVPDAPETDLNLKLVALFMSTGDSGTSSATIITPDNTATRYEPGEEILPGVMLDRVLSDRAIITRDGREETIMRSGRDAGLSVIGDPATARNEAGRVTSESPSLFEPGLSARTLLAGIDAEPRMRNDVVSSLVLRPKGDGSLMRAAGLEPGDQLLNVNGVSVSETDLSALSTELEAGGVATLDLQRSGETRTIEIRFEEERE
ncbi:type II secretion system protein N [Henriciella sp.]|uniref:type II secretion system protein N n=1 Tax=Henriciella sp. TaxID=1968823 RepID=UPI00261A379B|nr:type II secretion system protein N [Henriciella sp.]